MRYSSENVGCQGLRRDIMPAQSTVLVDTPPEARTELEEAGWTGNRFYWLRIRAICTLFSDSCRIVGMCSGAGRLLNWQKRRAGALSDGCGVISKSFFPALETCGEKRPIMVPAGMPFACQIAVCREKLPDPGGLYAKSFVIIGKRLWPWGSYFWRIDCGSGYATNPSTGTLPTDHAKTRSKDFEWVRMRQAGLMPIGLLGFALSGTTRCGALESWRGLLDCLIDLGIFYED